MKLTEILYHRVTSSYAEQHWLDDDLLESIQSGGIMFEMANLRSSITDLPPNIILWTRPEPDKNLEHNEYRIKVYKDNKHSATYLVSRNSRPALFCKVSKKYQLSTYERSEIKKFVNEFAGLLISYIDGKISVDELETEIQKSR
jgi:hypothetical protein